MSNPRFIRLGTQAYPMNTIRNVEFDNTYHGIRCTLTYYDNISSIEMQIVFYCSEKIYLDVKAFRDSILS